MTVKKRLKVEIHELETKIASSFHDDECRVHEYILVIKKQDLEGVRVEYDFVQGQIMDDNNVVVAREATHLLENLPDVIVLVRKAEQLAEKI